MDIGGFRLTEVPADFFDDPYRYYAALREQRPVHELEPGSYFLSRYEDVVALYRDARASSDKKVEFKPKFGDSPLYEHHTTSLVFNDPPLHTRVRALMMGALNQRAIARMEAGVASLVERLLDSFPAGEFDFIDAFAARIPVEVIGNLLDIPGNERGPLRAWSIAILSGLEPKPSAEMHPLPTHLPAEKLPLLPDSGNAPSMASRAGRNVNLIPGVSQDEAGVVHTAYGSYNPVTGEGLPIDAPES